MFIFDRVFMGVIDRIAVNCHKGIGQHQDMAQVMCVAEEAGEFLKAGRRYLGLSRKPRDGAFEEMEEELADTIISSLVAASTFNIDIEDAINRKLNKIEARGGF